MKKCVVFILITMILFHSIALAVPTQKKNETVYINLSDYGEVSEINIYNKCEVNGSNTITDYTNFTEVTNLSNKEDYEKNEAGITWNVSGQKSFSYTGKVGEEYYNLIPWTFNISYELNGVEIQKEELLGASGLVKIKLKINANKEANSYYQNNYILEITGSYDMSQYLSVSSEEAMITDNGNSKTLMFIVLPGQSTNLTIEIGTDDFQMDGITMAMVPLSGDLLNEVAEMAEDKREMENAIDAMNSSTDVVLNSLYGMTSGLTGISEGVKEIKSGVNEIHGLNSLRNQDIENLKKILSDVLPIIQNVQVDLDNMTNTYSIFMELSNALTDEAKNLKANISNLDDDLEILEDMSEDLPKDVNELNDLMKTLSMVTKDLDKLLEDMSSAKSTELAEIQQSMSDMIETLSKITVQSETLIQLTGGVNPALTEALEDISEESQSVCKSLYALGNTLSSLSSNLPNTKNTSKDLQELSSQLRTISKLLDAEDAEVFEDTISDTRKVVTSLENMINIATEYSDKLSENEEDVYTLINNMKQLINEINEMDVLSLSMINNLQTMLNALSSSIYQGSDKTTDELLNVNNQLINIAKESNAIKNSKNEVKNILDDKWDEVEEKTTIFNIEKDAKVVSFGNSENENVESVQFILKTPDIKKIKVENDDMENTNETLNFGQRLLYILNQLFGWIFKIFVK